MRRLRELSAAFGSTFAAFRITVGYCWPTLPRRACSPLASVFPASGVRPHASGVWGETLKLIFVVENRFVGDGTIPSILRGQEYLKETRVRGQTAGRAERGKIGIRKDPAEGVTHGDVRI